MKKVLLGIGVSVCLLLGFTTVQQRDATALPLNDDMTAKQVASPTATQVADQASSTEYDVCEPSAKKCGFNSDCKYGKCKSGKCGSCGFKSDCKGWGKCSNGWCGACGFDSECKGFGKCSKGKCTKSPY